MSDLSNVRINGQRLWDALMEMAKIGGTPKGGCKRLTLTDLDKQGRELFTAWCEKEGCVVKVDEMGNMFARRPGVEDDLASSDDGLPSRHPTDGRQIRRRSRRAGRAGSGAIAQRSQDQDAPPDRDRQLDQRRRVALCAGDDFVGRVRWRLYQGIRLFARRRRRQETGRRTRAHRLSRAASPSAAGRSTPSSNCISNRDRFSKTNRSTSASSLMARVSAGMKSA